MKNFLSISLISLFYCVIISSCKDWKDKEIKSTLFESIPVEKTGITFENILKPNFENNILEYDYFYNGSGVGAADFNNDGLCDLFFTGNQVQGKLYINKGNFKFLDQTEQAGILTKGWGTGVSIADVNQDGWEDIYVCNAGLNHSHNQLFINLGKQADGSIKFIEKAKEYGIDYKGFSTQAAFFDYDKDGDLDLYLLIHFHSKLNPNYPKDKALDGSGPSNGKLFKNENGKFIEVSKQAGINTEGFGLGIAIADLNSDGWQDIYISNDFAYDDLIYINNKNGTFTESVKKLLSHTSRFSMGCDVADFNNDMLPDIFVADMLPYENKRQKLMSMGVTNNVFKFSLLQGYLPQYSRNVLQLNNGMQNGNISFSEIGQLAGVSKTDWSWSALFADLDNDGWKDLFISNGIPKDITNSDFTSYRSNEFSKQNYDYITIKKQLLEKLEGLESVDKPNFVYKNNSDLTFSDQSKNWGLDREGFSNGTVLVDLDNDGDLDLVTNNLNSKPFVFKNNSDKLLKNHFLNIKLKGYISEGAKIKISHNKKLQFLEHNLYRGFQSTQQYLVHFGLGKDSLIDIIEVLWPDGKYQKLMNTSANQTLTIEHKNACRPPQNFTFLDDNSSGNPLFYDATEELKIDFDHKEIDFEDFDFEPLLPHKFSRNGPFIAVGDVDGNGREDFWIGGPAKISGKLFLQQANGSFISKEMQDAGFEDMGGLFFDADNDGDLDLYIVSGGNEYNALSEPYQDRLYLNDGKGNFERKIHEVPIEYSSGSCVKAIDFDKDGDLDLFVGGRVIPAKYPYAPESFILENDGKGNFSNSTLKLCKEISKIGMVTDALWSDFDNDGYTDLVITGEWMPVLFFKNIKGKAFVNLNTGIEKQAGWYFSLATGDFDKDGDLDYLAGNLSLNSKFKATYSEPLTVYAKDLDGNNKTEILLSYYLNGKECMVVDRDRLALQYPLIKKKFNSYTAFAEADFNNILTEADRKDALILKATCLSSLYIENKGKGKFVNHILPIKAQFSTIQTMVVQDFDKDGNLDVLTAGNFYSPDFVTGRYDASIGLLLNGDGRGNFKPVAASQSGIFLPGDIRAMAGLKVNRQAVWLVAANSGKLKAIKSK